MNRYELEPDTVYTRQELACRMGLEDRAMRSEVRAMRRAGIPVLAVKGGGYKLAETEQEKRELLNMYRHRAIDELTTYNRLLRNMQIDGQVTIQILMGAAEE